MPLKIVRSFIVTEALASETYINVSNANLNFLENLLCLKKSVSIVTQVKLLVILLNRLPCTIYIKIYVNESHFFKNNLFVMFDSKPSIILSSNP